MILFVFPPKFLRKGCFQFPLGLTIVPRENKNDAYAKFWATNKEYYGIFRNGQWQSHVWFTWFGTNRKRRVHQPQPDWPLFFGTSNSKFR